MATLLHAPYTDRAASRLCLPASARGYMYAPVSPDTDGLAARPVCFRPGT